MPTICAGGRSSGMYGDLRMVGLIEQDELFGVELTQVGRD